MSAVTPSATIARLAIATLMPALAVAPLPVAATARTLPFPTRCHTTYSCQVIRRGGDVVVFPETPRPPREPIVYPRTFALWLPTGRSTALGDLDEEGVLDPRRSHFALAGEYVAYALPFEAPHAEGIRWQVIRMNARTGREEKARRRIGRCLLEDRSETFDAHRVEEVAVTPNGRVAWIFGGYFSSPPNYRVCELPPRSRTPVLLASSATIAPESLRLGAHRISWIEGGEKRGIRLR